MALKPSEKTVERSPVGSEPGPHLIVVSSAKKPVRIGLEMPSCVDLSLVLKQRKFFIGWQLDAKPRCQQGFPDPVPHTKISTTLKRSALGFTTSLRPGRLRHLPGLP
jgi:hypothetical protein